MYRACFADGSELRVRHGREAMTEEIRQVCGPGEAAAFDGFCDWLGRLYRTEMPHFIERNYDSPLDLVRPLGPALDLVRLGAFGRLGRAVARGSSPTTACGGIFSFQALYAGLAPYEALALYAVITYMDVGQRRLRARSAACTRCRGPWPRPRPRPAPTLRYDAPVERILLAARLDGPGARRAPRRRRGDRGRRRRVQRRPAGGLPHAAARAAGAPAWPAAAATRRRRVVWHVGVRGALPPGAAHHNIHFGRPWDGAFRALLATGAACPTRRCWSPCRPSSDPAMAPAGRHVLYVLEPVPNLDGRVDWTTERARARDDLAAAVTAVGYPTDVEVEELVDPLDWEAQGMERGTPFALAHTFLQTGPFRPANVASTRPRAWCSPARAPCPASASRWCSCPACWRPSGSARCCRERAAVRRCAGSVTLDASYRLCRARQPAPRHDVLLVDARAAPAEAPPRVGALRVLPVRRRHRRRPRRRPGRRRGRRRSTDLGDRFFADLAAGSVRRPGARGRRAHRAGLRPSTPTCFRRFLALDGDGPDVDRLRDLGRPARLHGRLGGGDRRDDAADPRTARPGGGARHRPATSASRSSSPTSSATSARTSTAGGCTCPRRTSSASAPTRAPRRVDAAWRAADALRDRPVPRPVPVGRPWASRCCRRPRPAACAPPACSTPGSSTASRTPTTTCSRSGPACRPGARSGRRARHADRRRLSRAARGPRRPRPRGRACCCSPASRPPRRSPGDGRDARPASVSVVVPARDEERTLPRPARVAAAALDPAPHEVIVVDDGSTDAHRRGGRRPRRPRCSSTAPRRRAGGQAVGVPRRRRGRHRHPPAVPRRRHVARARRRSPDCVAEHAPPGGLAVGAAVPPHRAGLRAAVGLLQRRRR